MIGIELLMKGLGSQERIGVQGPKKKGFRGLKRRSAGSGEEGRPREGQGQGLKKVDGPEKDKVRVWRRRTAQRRTRSRSGEEGRPREGQGQGLEKD